ncbi:MAG: DUF1801 domain-containing protein [Rubricoccaceae bacterium]|nr:DUF1801 domain-containing protein [Rubricoccaceae bacterium]
MAKDLKIQPGESIDDWITRHGHPVGTTLRALRALVHDRAPHLDEAVRWSQPWYQGTDAVFYLAAQRAYATLGFCNGAHLDDPDRLLEGSGKNMRHVKIDDPGAIQDPPLLRLVDAALAHDASL